MGNLPSILATGQGVWAWLRIGIVLFTVLGAYFRMEARVEAAEKRAESITQTLEDLRGTLGILQLDIAQLCTATVGLEKCWTAGRGTR